MDENDGETSTTSASQGGGTSLPRTSKRPTIIRPASKVSPAEPPPRPMSRPNNVISSINSQKADVGLPGKTKPVITVIDARPITELGFRDMKGSADNLPASLTAGTGGASVESTQLRSHPEGGQVSMQAPDAESGQDNEHNSKISQKPSAPPKSIKPTIIRPGSRAQPVTGEDKPLPAPPPRPASTPKSDPSLPKSTSVQGIQNSPQQPLQAKFSWLESPNTPSTNNHPPVQSSPSPQGPKRPPRFPSKTTANIQEARTKLGADSEIQSSPKETPMKNKSHDPESPKTQPALPKPKPKPVPKPRPVSVRSPGFRTDVTSENNVNKDVNTKTCPPDLSSQSHDTQEEIRSQQSQWSPVTNDEKIGQNQRLSLAPVPLRKPPRLTESAHKPEAVSTTDVSEKTVQQDSTADAGRNDSRQEELLPVHKHPPAVPPMSHTSGSTGSKPSPITVKKPDISSNTSSHIDHKPESAQKPEAVSTTDVSEKTVKQDSTADAGRKNSQQEELLPVHKHPPAVPPMSHTSGSTGSKPSPITVRKPDTSSNTSSHIDHKPASSSPQKVPPGRPARSAPARGKSMAISEKIPPVSDSNSSSSNTKKVDTRKPSQPAASRSQIKSAEVPPLPKRPGPGHPLYHYMSGQPHGIAKHDYTAAQLDELSFSKGDTVILVKEIDEQWVIGRIGDHEGMFPAAFIDIRCPINEKKPNSSIVGMDSWSVSDSKGQKPDSLTGPRCKARFDFEGDGEGELMLEDGDVVQITERVGTEWLRGQSRGRQGIFPSSFVEIVEDLPADSSTCGQILSNVVSGLFDFDGKDGELIFKAGDQITVLGEVNSEWLFGACHGQEGQFPTSFVSHVPSDLPQHKPDHSAHKSKQTPPSEQGQHARKHQGSPVQGDEFWESREDVLGFCRAMFDYLDPSPGDLEFRKGDRIEIVEFVGEDWARGRLGRKEGMLPLRFVAEEVNSPPRTPEPEVVKKVFGKVLHKFDGETPDDLMIKEGDIIEVEDFADVNKNWRWGVLDGKRGMFPAEFVEIME